MEWNGARRTSAVVFNLSATVILPSCCKDYGPCAARFQDLSRTVTRIYYYSFRLCSWILPKGFAPRRGLRILLYSLALRLKGTVSTRSLQFPLTGTAVRTPSLPPPPDNLHGALSPLLLGLDCEFLCKFRVASTPPIDPKLPFSFPAHPCYCGLWVTLC